MYYPNKVPTRCSLPSSRSSRNSKSGDVSSLSAAFGFWCGSACLFAGGWVRSGRAIDRFRCSGGGGGGGAGSGWSWSGSVPWERSEESDAEDEILHLGVGDQESDDIQPRRREGIEGYGGSGSPPNQSDGAAGGACARDRASLPLRQTSVPCARVCCRLFVLYRYTNLTTFCLFRSLSESYNVLVCIAWKKSIALKPLTCTRSCSTAFCWLLINI